MAYKLIDLPLFGGLDYRSEQTKIPSGKLLDGRNFNIFEDKTAETVAGYVSRLDNGAGRIPSMFSFLRESGTEEIYFIYTTVLYKFNTDYTASSIKTGLTSNLRHGFTSYNDKLYFNNATDGGFRYNGTNVYQWGITAPGTTPTYVSEAATGSLTLLSTYQYRYTYWNNTDGVESEGSDTVSHLLTGGNNQINIGVTASADAQVTHIRIYRTNAGGSIFYREQQVDNTTATVASTIADSSLGVAYYTSGYGTPPKSNIIAQYNNYIFMVDADNPYNIRYSENGLLGAGYVEYYPATNVLAAEVAFTGIAVAPNGVLTFEKDKSVLYAGTTPSQFVPQNLSPRIGCSSHESIAYYGDVPIWCDANSIYLFDGASIIDIGYDISPTFKSYDKTNAFGIVNPNKHQYILFCASATGSTPAANDIALVYNLKTREWSPIRDTQVFLSGVYKKSADVMYVGGRNDGHIFELDSGTDFAGTSITAYVKTPYMNFEDLSYKLLREYIMVAKSTGDIDITVYTENDSTGYTYRIRPSDTAYTILKRLTKYLSVKRHNGIYICFKIANVSGSRLFIGDHKLVIGTRAIP